MDGRLQYGVLDGVAAGLVQRHPGGDAAFQFGVGEMAQRDFRTHTGGQRLPGGGVDYRQAGADLVGGAAQPPQHPAGVGIVRWLADGRPLMHYRAVGADDIPGG